MRSFLLLFSAVWLGCGNPPSGDSSLLRVGGTYQTAVTLQEDHCGGIVVQANPTIVTHSAGASALTLSHAGNQFSGSVQSSGAFATTPKVLSQGSETSTLTITGQFSPTGFVATVTVDVQRAAGACSYVVRWVGTKEGSPNVIPG